MNEITAEQLWVWEKDADECAIPYLGAVIRALCLAVREQQEAIAKLEAMLEEQAARPGDDEV